MLDTVNVCYHLANHPIEVFLEPSQKHSQSRQLQQRCTTSISKIRDAVQLGPPLQQLLKNVDEKKAGLTITYWNDRRSGRRIFVEGSLPKLLYGTNVALISNQREIDGAIQIIKAILQKKGFKIRSGPYFRRIDLVWHFARRPEEVMFAHFATTHRNLLREHVCLHRVGRRFTGVTWNGSEMIINLYDKVAKTEVTRQGRPAPSENYKLRYVRFEVQLLTPKEIRQVFRREIRAPKFDECYEAYRKIVTDFSVADEKLNLGPEPAKDYLIDFNRELPLTHPPLPFSKTFCRMWLRNSTPQNRPPRPP